MGGSSMNQAPGTDDLKKAVDNPTGLLSSGSVICSLNLDLDVELEFCCLLDLVEEDLGGI